MTCKRPYPESYQAVHHRAPRVATLLDGRSAVLAEPGFEVVDQVRLHLCEAAPAREGLPGDGQLLVGPVGATFPCGYGARIVAGIWCDRHGRLLLAWSDGQEIFVRRTIEPAGKKGVPAVAAAWESLPVSLSGAKGFLFLGSGQIDPRNSETLWLAALRLPTGEIMVTAAGKENANGKISSRLHAHELNHTPTLALDPDGRTLHVVWDTENLRILYRPVPVDLLRSGEADKEEPIEVWWYCHHPDVAANGREVVIAYTNHMHNIKYGYFDGADWHRNQCLTLFHPRFAETLEHSPWFWTDESGVIHLRFVCLTRRLVYDAAWLGDGFADPQPVEGLFHPSLFNDDVRVRAERMSLDRQSGVTILSSTFLPERHGVYAPTEVPSQLAPDQSVLFLDLAEVAEMRGLTSELVTMRHDPAAPVFEPTGDPLDFDGARVLNNGTVLKDGDRYRMWYSALALNTELKLNWYDQVYVGYAESSDGVSWRRVDTGLDATFRDRPAPNLIRRIHHNACVFIDPDDEPSRRYKAIKFESRAQRYDRVKSEGELGYLGLPRRGWLCTSPDGIHWRREEVSVDFPGPEPYGFQPQKALHDPDDPDPARRYKVIGFTSLIGRRRCATLAYSPDCRHWTVAERSPLLDPMACVSPVRPAGPYAQIHDAAMARYGRYLFAFYQNQFDGGSADIRLAVSRDNQRFTFVHPETPLVAQGEPGSWNSGYVMPVDLVVEDEEMWLYYGSSSDEVDTASGTPLWRVCAGRGVTRRDGFVRITPKEAGQTCSLVTIPFTVTAPGPFRLELNADLAGDSVLRVGLAGDTPGFSVSDCHPIRGDSIRHHATWARGAALPLDHRPFRLHFELQGTTTDALYSWTLVPPARA